MTNRLSIDQELRREYLKAVTRRQLFRRCTTGMGAIALASLMKQDLLAAVGTGGAASTASVAARKPEPLSVKAPHFKPRAKNIIYLHMAGAPSQLDLFDPKPKLNEYNGQP